MKIKKLTKAVISAYLLNAAMMVAVIVAVLIQQHAATDSQQAIVTINAIIMVAVAINGYEVSK